VPASAMSEAAEDLKAIFKVRREKTAKALLEEFVSLYEKHYPKAVSVFEAGIGDALTYLGYPGSHHARIRTTNVLERLFKEVKRTTKVVGVFSERDERGYVGDGDHAQEQRRVGVEALPHDAHSRDSGKTEPTTCETLTSFAAVEALPRWESVCAPPLDSREVVLLVPLGLAAGPRHSSDRNWWFRKYLLRSSRRIV
jgi:Transposase, Mutator family